MTPHTHFLSLQVIFVFLYVCTGAVTSKCYTVAFLSQKINRATQVTSPSIEHDEYHNKISFSVTRRPPPALYYSTDDVSKNSIVNDKIDSSVHDINDGDDKRAQLLSLYQSVAQQDPQWYDKFVTNVLTSIPMSQQKTRPTLTPKQKQRKQNPECVILKSKTADSGSSSSKVRARVPVIIGSVNMTSAAAGDATTTKTTVNATTLNVTINKVTESPTGAVRIKKESAFSSKEFLSDKPTITAFNEVANRTYVDKEIVTDIKNVVIYKDMKNQQMQSVPLINLTKLGYTEGDILVLHSDVVELILSDQVSKPRMGIPPQWKAATLSAQIKSPQDTEKGIAYERNIRSSMSPSSGSSSSSVAPAARVEEKDLSMGAMRAPGKLEGQGSTAAVEISFGSESRGTKAVKVSLSSNQPTGYKKNIQTEATQESNAVGAPSLESPVMNSTTSRRDDSMDLLVVYKESCGKLQAVSLAEISSLGYGNAEILSLQPDVLGLIVAGKMARPRAGIPPTWQQATRQNGRTSTDVQLLTGAELEKLQNPSNEKAGPLAHSFAAESQGPTPSTSTGELKEEELMATHPSGIVNATSPIGVSKPKRLDDAAQDVITNKTSPNSVTSEKNQNGGIGDIRAVASPPGKDRRYSTGESESQYKSLLEGRSEISARMDKNANDDSVVSCFDYAQAKKRIVPMEKLAFLGYCEEDVENLQPHVLATILANGTRKPRTGVPSNWCNPSSTNLGKAVPDGQRVEVVPWSHAETLATKVNGGKGISAEPGRGVSAGNKSRPIRDSRGPLPLPQRQRGERSREKEAFNADGSEKSIYSARPGNNERAKRRRSGDPPPPKFRFLWNDMDSFRDLLRKEAELRMRLTGGRFAAVSYTHLTLPTNREV